MTARSPDGIAGLSAGNGLDPDFLTVTMTEAKILPPSAQQFATIIQQCGPDTLRDLNETFGLFKPEAPLLNAGTVNGLGYQSLQSGDAQKALVIFGFNTQSNPGSANAWDSYGEACLGVGDNAEALRAYRKALELIPTDSTLTDQFRDMIQRGATATIERLEAEADGGAGTE